MRGTRGRLPEIGTPTERLLSGYAASLLGSLRDAQVAPAVVVELQRAANGLRRALNARELSERLATRADELAETAELAVEAELRALYEALSSDAALRGKLFPESLGGALAPRGEAQLAEVTRLLGIAQQAFADLLATAARTAVRLGAANAALSTRLSAANSAHETLVTAISAEQRQKRAFRERCRWALGALTGLFPDQAAKVVGFLQKPSRGRTQSKGIPEAPPPTGRASQRRTTRARPKAATKRKRP